jgi:hypothetical protein
MLDYSKFVGSIIRANIFQGQHDARADRVFSVAPLKLIG